MSDVHSEPPKTTVCPQCAATIPVAPGYLVWCDQCEWNLIRSDNSETLRFSHRINAKFGARYSADLFKRAMDNAGALKSGFSFSLVLAYTFATLVHTATVAVLIGGIALLTMGWPNIFAAISGVLCISLSWVLRPRFGSAPESVLPREDYPKLYGFVQEIADEMGFGRVEGILVDSRINASFQRVGWRGCAYITIGLPLFAILTADAKAALLGHEVGHGVNGDVQR